MTAADKLNAVNVCMYNSAVATSYISYRGKALRKNNRYADGTFKPAKDIVYSSSEYRYYNGGTTMFQTYKRAALPSDSYGTPVYVCNNQVYGDAVYLNSAAAVPAAAEAARLSALTYASTDLSHICYSADYIASHAVYQEVMGEPCLVLKVNPTLAQLQSWIGFSVHPGETYNQNRTVLTVNISLSDPGAFSTTLVSKVKAASDDTLIPGGVYDYTWNFRFLNINKTTIPAMPQGYTVKK
jgi:hypothetical protein